LLFAGEVVQNGFIERRPVAGTGMDCSPDRRRISTFKTEPMVLNWKTEATG